MQRQIFDVTWEVKRNDSLEQVAPPWCNDESQVNNTSWNSEGRRWITVVPLKCGKKVNHQLMSESISLVTGKRDPLDGKLRRRFTRRDMNILPGLTQAVTNESLPSKACN